MYIIIPQGVGRGSCRSGEPARTGGEVLGWLHFHSYAPGKNGNGSDCAASSLQLDLLCGLSGVRVLPGVGGFHDEEFEQFSGVLSIVMISAVVRTPASELS